jgi:hypothetical protein
MGVTLVLQKPIKYLDLADTVRFLLRARDGRVTRPPRAALASTTVANPRALVEGPPRPAPTPLPDRKPTHKS